VSLLYIFATAVLSVCATILALEWAVGRLRDADEQIDWHDDTV
jgi:hypothetical protein